MDKLYNKVSFTFCLKVFGLGVGFVFQIVLGRMLDPNLYGQYTMFLTYTSVLSIISILGMDRNLIKEIARVVENKAKTNSLLQFSLLVSIIITILLSVLIYILRKFLLIPSQTYYLLIFMVLLRTLASILDGFLQGLGLVVKVTLFNVVLNNILKILIFILMVIVKSEVLMAAVVSFILSETITVIIRVVSVKKVLHDNFKLKIDIDNHEKKEFLKYSRFR